MSRLRMPGVLWVPSAGADELGLLYGADLDQAELVGLLATVLERSAQGGATLITRAGKPIAAVVSVADYRAVEEHVDARFAEKQYPDDGGRIASEDLLAEDGGQ